MVIGFHNPDEPYGWLSNWYFSNFTVDGVDYSSMEQFMMHQKALLFNDTDTADKIMAISDFGKIKALGRQVHGFDDSIWILNREDIITKGLIAKFMQNKDLKELLLQTGDQTLAECAVHDRVWGIGLSMHDEKRLDQKQWRGQNLLGKCLMTVRSIFRAEQH